MNKKRDLEKRKKFIMELLGDPVYRPMRLRELATLLRLKKEQRKELYDVLDELSVEGKVAMDEKGRYEKITSKKKLKKLKKKTSAQDIRLSLIHI